MNHKFFIGCRVKLIHPLDAKDFGLEGFLESFEQTNEYTVWAEGVTPSYCNSEVLWDDEPDMVCWQNLDQLEVITPDGAQPSTMSMEELLESLQEDTLVCN